ncbi:UNVERIFIED_CONTAM: hypothetical protein Slati_0015400 [Sesamum latifolium]|uniref:Aminotransferase-like plant mobile domain-containing protein n=1 Tax=Sesamum latifolium TaxID=2727402 RepID=A0AAW2Y691_9LAMI
MLSRCGKRLRLINAYDAVYASLFTSDHNSDIIKAFCDAWCPLINTLLTSVGELSISLWDLHDLAGLPMRGCLYDELVPSALELTGADEKGGRFIPHSSKYLLYAYCLLQGADDDRCSNMSSDKWVKFWSKKAIKYHLPPPRKEKKMGISKEVYLAAYLDCWLCTFVLPSKDVNSIRPSTFKMPSMMASGRRVSLAIPVLVSIYEGLNTIATSSRPAHTSPSFPVHFVYAWLAYYFKTHYPVWQGLRGPKMTRFSGEGGAKYYDPQEARKRIHNAEFVSWACNMIAKDRPFKFIDNGDAKELDHDYFIAIRSSYLTLRQGDKFIIEPYSLHRFGRQFGYFQDVPEPLKYDTRAASLEEGLRYWRLCVLSKSSSKAWLPGLPTNTKKFCSEAYKAWWAKVHGTFLDDNIACLISPKPTKITIKPKKHEDEQVDGGENNPPHVLVPSIVVKSNSRAVAVEASKGKEDEIQSINASEESETRKATSQPPAVSVLEAKARLQDVQAKASEGASKVRSIVDELEHVEKEIVALKGRRTSLCAALKEQKQLNHNAQAKVHEVEEDIATLDNTAPLDDAIVEDSKANLEIFKEDLKSLKPFA